MMSMGASDLDEAIDQALAQRPEASALACVDARSGLVLASAARSEEALDAISSTGVTSSVLSAPPSFEGREEGEPVPPSDRTLVMTRRWVQVHEGVPGRPGLFVVGVADAGANVGLLASCVRDVSSLLGARGLGARG